MTTRNLIVHWGRIVGDSETAADGSRRFRIEERSIDRDGGELTRCIPCEDPTGITRGFGSGEHLGLVGYPETRTRNEGGNTVRHICLVVQRLTDPNAKPLRPSY